MKEKRERGKGGGEEKGERKGKKRVSRSKK